MNGMFRKPLVRWCLTALTAFALLTGQPGPFLVYAVLAAYSWHYAR